MIYLVLAVLFLHIISVPLVISAVVYVDSNEDKGELRVKLFFIPVFVKKFAVNDIVKRLSEKKAESANEDKSQEQDKDKNNGVVKRILIAFAWELIKRMRVRDIELDARLGIGDAAMSACTVGAIQVIYEQIKAVLGFDGGRADIRPDYDAECIFFDFFGIISICFGDIIYAACSAVLSAMTKGARTRRNYANTVTE